LISRSLFICLVRGAVIPEAYDKKQCRSAV
jgi:hypothetical protein